MSVAQRSRPWPLAAFELCPHPFSSLGGEVPAIEVGQHLHQRLSEPSRWLSLIELLFGGDDVDARFVQFILDGDRFAEVAAEAVVLVDKDVLEPSGASPADHLVKNLDAFQSAM
ncbi:MAG TPA: hypothetical protein VHK65_00470 [Candidatus Dormibacteraeota bacterium]|nr:hypothetical protein [Candidatus Dormibacteraeota bacterium]